VPARSWLSLWWIACAGKLPAIEHQPPQGPLLFLECLSHAAQGVPVVLLEVGRMGHQGSVVTLLLIFIPQLVLFVPNLLFG